MRACVCGGGGGGACIRVCVEGIRQEGVPSKPEILMQPDQPAGAAVAPSALASSPWGISLVGQAFGSA